MMQLSSPSTALFVRDIHSARKFYESILGLAVELDFGKNIIFKGGLAIWEINPAHVIPRSLGEQKISDRLVNRFELYFETENIDDCYLRLKDDQVEFLHELNEEAWGQRTIRFFDPDRHLIEIGESLKQFVTRFYKQGLTMEEVARRTHVPVDEVKRLVG